MSVTGGNETPNSEARPEMINLSNIIRSLTRIEVALSNLDKAIRAVGDRVNRRARNERWMNG